MRTDVALPRAGIHIRLAGERWSHILENHPEMSDHRAAKKNATMALRNFPENLSQYVGLVTVVRNAPGNRLWSSYDEEGDVLYVHFREPSVATDSELTDEDIIVRYEGEQVIGLTILHASRR